MGASGEGLRASGRDLPATGRDSGESWDVVAEWWEDRTDGNDVYREHVHGPALLGACGVVDGLDVLDVGCGSGYFSRELARAGARVQAFDYSKNLVGLADEREQVDGLGIDYQVLDAVRLADNYGLERLDVVTGCMSITDIEELDAALDGVFRVLKPGGAFCFSLPHPFATPPENRWWLDDDSGESGRSFTRYFGRRRVASGLNRVAGKPDGPEIQVWHMPISEWLELLSEIGFVVERVIEPQPTAEQAKAHPLLARIANIPEFMVISARRT